MSKNLIVLTLLISLSLAIVLNKQGPNSSLLLQIAQQDGFNYEDEKRVKEREKKEKENQEKNQGKKEMKKRAK